MAIRRILPNVMAGVCLYFAPTVAHGADCERMRRAIAESSRAPQYQGAIQRQRLEIDRTQAYAQQIGCENHKFLFFGSDPPAQCAQIVSRIGRMRANLEDLQAQAGGSGDGDLIARYNAECSGGGSRNSNVIDALADQPKPGDLQEETLGPDAGKRDEDSLDRPSPDYQAVAGGKAVCVRSCDGAFFPLSYSASGASAGALTDACRALCPNADVAVYSYPLSGEIEQAVSVTGSKYMDSPTALRYRHVFDPSCSCRRHGETWADALAPAERLLSKPSHSDIIVTLAKSEELSRPRPDAKAKGSKAAKTSAEGASGGPRAKAAPSPVAASDMDDANGVDTGLRDAAEAVSKDASGIGGSAQALGSDPVKEGHGAVIRQAEPDGSLRTVRVVGN